MGKGNASLLTMSNSRTTEISFRSIFMSYVDFPSAYNKFDSLGRKDPFYWAYVSGAVLNWKYQYTGIDFRSYLPGVLGGLTDNYLQRSGLRDGTMEHWECREEPADNRSAPWWLHSLHTGPSTHLDVQLMLTDKNRTQLCWHFMYILLIFCMCDKNMDEKIHFS